MFPLTLQVSLRRAALGKAQGDLTAVTFGDGSDEVLRRRTRAFGNFIEYVPLCLVTLTLTELAGASPTLLWSIGGLLVVGLILLAPRERLEQPGSGDPDAHFTTRSAP